MRKDVLLRRDPAPININKSTIESARKRGGFELDKQEQLYFEVLIRQLLIFFLCWNLCENQDKIEVLIH